MLIIFLSLFMLKDSELPLISNNQEPFTTSVHGIQLPDEEMSAAVMDGRSGLTEPASPSTLNEERALVMYRPSDAHMASSFKINPKLITGLKSKYTSSKFLFIFVFHFISIYGLIITVAIFMLIYYSEIIVLHSAA